MKNQFALFAASLLLLVASAGQAQDTGAPAPPPLNRPETTQVVIETTLGAITLALETERAPITANNFLRYADEHRLDGTEFYRVMKLDWGEQPNGLIQGGALWDPERILPSIAHEPTDQTGVHHTAGTISMARGEPGTANADFSILLGDLEGLDADPASDDPDIRAGYAAFGHVVSGMEVVRAIWNATIDPEKGEGMLKGQLLADPVKILRVRRVEDDLSTLTPDKP